MKKFNVSKLISDAGGVPKFASSIGVCRTTPYRWLAGGDISLKNLELIKSRLDVTLDVYFEDMRHDKPNDGRATIL